MQGIYSEAVAVSTKLHTNNDLRGCVRELIDLDFMIIRRLFWKSYPSAV